MRLTIDGTTIAKDILARTKARAERLPHPPLVVALVGEETPATRSYLAIKLRRAADAGCRLEIRPLGSDTADANAVIIQLPAPGAHLDSIPLERDADVLSAHAREIGSLLPPVVAAIQEILEKSNIPIMGKKAVVVGNGYLVGEPAALWMRKQGAEVTVLTRDGDLSVLKDADLIVSGAGSPHLIKPHMLKKGVVLIDAGTSESNGALAGDADPACTEVASLFTPVPGGVGPVAVAKLFENAVTLAERAMNP